MDTSSTFSKPLRPWAETWFAGVINRWFSSLTQKGGTQLHLNPWKPPFDKGGSPSFDSPYDRAKKQALADLDAIRKHLASEKTLDPERIYKRSLRDRRAHTGCHQDSSKRIDLVNPGLGSRRMESCHQRSFLASTPTTYGRRSSRPICGNDAESHLGFRFIKAGAQGHSVGFRAWRRHATAQTANG